jgi:hypothetical protein
MCACDVGFVCSQCAGTPFDPRYLEDEYEPMSLPDFDRLTAEPFAVRFEGWT